MLKSFPREIDEPLAHAALRSHGDSRGVRRSRRGSLNIECKSVRPICVDAQRISPATLVATRKQ